MDEKVKEYIENCQLIIHAGGRGERWSPVTNGEVVKPRTDVGKNPRPMIDWVMLPFVKAGIKNIFPTMWHRSETLKGHLENTSRQTDIKFNYLIEPEDRRIGRAGIIKESIKNGTLDLNKPIISTNGSDPISINVEELIKFHLEGIEKGIGVTVVGACEVPTEFGIYHVDPETKRVSGFKEKPVIKLSPDESAHTGMFVFDPSSISSFLEIDEKLYPVNIEDLKWDGDVFKNSRSYTGIVPFKQWIFFKNKKHFEQFGKMDLEKFMNVENVDVYLGKYEKE